MARTRGTSSPTAEPTGYTVIARRYRPQRFEDVVGQDHVVQSLRHAIRLNRVTHAYLFAGTRGVGKTSIARIFAKCLNCVKGPTETPCNECDVCQAITVGQDVDVIEIDGASHNGVEAVRELRQNAGLRPSRARFKIYYIDEVHMLSPGAFNALLKTLEEPPEHVKFFFATTEPNKIPITVLSRCQRYDLAGIGNDQVVATLQEICTRENVDVEPEALQAIARRSSGSLRDAQSLLEQLLSSGSDSLTLELVHQRLGTASDERLLDLVDALAGHDPAAALRQIDEAAGEGVQPTDLLNGLLEFLRDLMVLSTGCDSLLLAATSRQLPRLQNVVDQWPIDSILAGLQILAETRGRLRGSPHGRLLVEMALVRVARLENLTDLSTMIDRLAAIEAGGPQLSLATPTSALRESEPGTRTVKKKAEVQDVSDNGRSAVGAGASLEGPLPGPAVETRNEDALAARPALEIEAVRQVWPALVKKLGLGFGVHLMPYNDRLASHLAILKPNILVITVPPGYNLVAGKCDTPQGRGKIEQALQFLLHRPVSVRFEGLSEEGAGTLPGPAPGTEAPKRPGDALEGDPMVRKVIELFEARPMHMEYDDESPRSPVS
ncbi:MAG: DNA polymerase III subunit gamma/tau [Isosphaeraceae bacterium]